VTTIPRPNEALKTFRVRAVVQSMPRRALNSAVEPVEPVEPAPSSDVHTRMTGPPPARDAGASAVRVRLQVPVDVGETVDGPVESAPPPVRSGAELEGRLLRALHEGDASAALMLASTLAYLYPAHPVARRIKARCAARVSRAFPPPNAVPRMALAWDAILERTLSHEAAYVLACIDGASNVEAIVDVSALQPLVAYEALDWLIGAGMVALS
jgi:hypothetical protein